MEKNNQRDQKKEDRNVESAPEDTTTRKFGEQHSITNLKTRTIPVFTCRTFQPNYSKSTHGNKTRFPEDLARSHRKTDQDTPR